MPSTIENPEDIPALESWEYGGFTFRGVHSSIYGVFETPQSRVLMPQKRRTLIDIPGRSTAFVQQDGGYDARVESVLCSYVPLPGISLQRHVRRVAAWLSGIGELTFDYEPEMHYWAFLSSPPPTTKQMAMNFAQFELEFTCNHPFAYETAEQHQTTMTQDVQYVIEAGGTVETPARIVIKNIGSTTINHLVIYAKHTEHGV